MLSVAQSNDSTDLTQIHSAYKIVKNSSVSTQSYKPQPTDQTHHHYNNMRNDNKKSLAEKRQARKERKNKKQKLQNKNDITGNTTSSYHKSRYQLLKDKILERRKGFKERKNRFSRNKARNLKNNHSNTNSITTNQEKEVIIDEANN